MITGIIGVSVNDTSIVMTAIAVTMIAGAIGIGTSADSVTAEVRRRVPRFFPNPAVREAEP